MWVRARVRWLRYIEEVDDPPPPPLPLPPFTPSVRPPGTSCCSDIPSCKPADNVSVYFPGAPSARVQEEEKIREWIPRDSSERRDDMIDVEGGTVSLPRVI